MALDFIYPENLRFECNGCALCCGDTPQKTRHILLLESEAQKIAADTGQQLADFAVPVNNKDPYVYEMKKLSDGKCIFLKDSRCRIYALRPLVCMFYPFEMKFDSDKGQYIFSFTAECPTLGQGKLFGKPDFKKLFEKAQERLT